MHGLLQRRLLLPQNFSDMQKPEKNENTWSPKDEQEEYRRYSSRRYHYLTQKVTELGPPLSNEKFQPLHEQVNMLLLTEMDADMGFDQIASRLMETIHRLLWSIEPGEQSAALVKQVVEQVRLQVILAEFFYWQALNGHRV